MTLGSELHLEQIADVCRRYAVRELAIFGSAARGEMLPESDVDILVEFSPGARVGLVKFASLTEELERLFGRPVDLVSKPGLKPWIRAHVLQEARTLYAA
jgi:predicted nucleotidyltransferase